MADALSHRYCSPQSRRSYAGCKPPHESEPDIVAIGRETRNVVAYMAQ
jgi:hypothetical protein